MTVLLVITLLILITLLGYGFWYYSQTPEHTDYLVNRDNQWFAWENGHRLRQAINNSDAALHGDYLYGNYSNTDDALAWCNNYSHALEKPRDARICVIYANGHVLNLTHKIRIRPGINDHANVVAYGNHVILNVKYFDDADTPNTYGYCQLYRIGSNNTVILLKTIQNTSGTVDASSFRTIDVNGEIKLWNLDGTLVHTNSIGKLTDPIRCRYYNNVWLICSKLGVWMYYESSKRLVEMFDDFGVGTEVMLPDVVVSEYDMLGHFINCIDEYSFDGKLRKSYRFIYKSSMFPVSRNFMKVFANNKEHILPNRR